MPKMPQKRSALDVQAIAGRHFQDVKPLTAQIRAQVLRGATARDVKAEVMMLVASEIVGMAAAARMARDLQAAGVDPGSDPDVHDMKLWGQAVLCDLEEMLKAGGLA